MTGYQSKKAMAQAKLDSMEREALKMALEALKYSASMGHGRMVRGMFAPFTIKEALAVHPRKAQGEEHMTGYQSKKAAARDKMAQPEQEPVALVIDGVLVKSALPEKYTGHLYTAPPQRPWVEPTGNEWFDWWRVSPVANETEAEIDFADFFIIAQAVVAKLKDDNK